MKQRRPGGAAGAAHHSHTTRYLDGVHIGGKGPVVIVRYRRRMKEEDEKKNQKNKICLRNGFLLNGIIDIQITIARFFTYYFVDFLSLSFFFFFLNFFFFFAPLPICDEWLAAHSIASSIEEFVHKRNCRDMKNIHRLNKWVPRALRVCCVVTRRGGSGHSKILFCHKFISSCFFCFFGF